MKFFGRLFLVISVSVFLVACGRAEDETPTNTPGPELQIPQQGGEAEVHLPIAGDLQAGEDATEDDPVIAYPDPDSPDSGSELLPSEPTATVTPTATVEPTLPPTPEPSPTIEPTNTATTTPPPSEPVIYVVQEGDQLGLIAQQFGVSTQALATANGIEIDAPILVGQELVIPVAGIIEYVVQVGDSLQGIAERFGVSAETIITTNNIDNPDHIEVGQTLIIPIE